MRFSAYIFMFFSLFLTQMSHAAMSPECKDTFLWLEDIDGKRPLAWVEKHNEKTLKKLEASPRFEKIKEAFLEEFNAVDRIPWVSEQGGWYYNFWQDSTHVKGVLRRATPESYRSKRVKWEVVLDVDKLARSEKEDWVYKSRTPLADGKSGKYLIALSRGGGDKVVVREFDLATKSFVKDGFVLPEAKSNYAWVDENTLLVSTDFGKGTLTDSGYARQVRLWKRGTPLQSSKLLFESEVSDVSASPMRIQTSRGNYFFITREIKFFDSETYLVSAGGKLTKLPFPNHVSLKDVFNGQLLLGNDQDWEPAPGLIFKSGSVLALPLAALSGDWVKQLTPLYEPSADSTLESLSTSKDFVFLNVLKNVQGQIFQLRQVAGQWRRELIPVPAGGMPAIDSISHLHNKLLLGYEDFLTSSSLLEYDADALTAPTTIKAKKPSFPSEDYVAEQRFSTSTDGTKIPYFIVHKKGLVLNGKNPTLLYGYGGFQISLTPHYLGTLGNVWLEQGGVYVVANIRGGGEFGPAWHQAAILDKRQNAYDDFASVARHLIDTKVTSPENLGVMGGSNGGLLVGVFFTQHPELCNAVVCQVPLLDMLRYHKLLAGASWMAEYGNPDIPEERAVIAHYSPYQNIHPSTDYPSIFFQSSTRDDRVHPGHGRKMAAQLEAYGHPVYFYENTDGGHAGSADLNRRAEIDAMTYTYLLEKLSR